MAKKLEEGQKRISTVGYVNGLKRHRHTDGSEVIYYKFKFKGEDYNGSTDTNVDAEAVAHLEALKTDLRRQFKQGAHTRLSLPSLSKIHSDWLDLAKTQFSANHRKSFDSYWRLHIEPALGALPLDKITTDLVEKCRSAYLEKGGTSGGANSLVKALNTLYGFAIRRKILLVRPYDVSKLRVQRIPRPVLPAQAVQKFLAEIDRSRNPNVRGIIRLMLGLGLRENEALNARWEHLDLRRKTYQPPKTRGGKAPVLAIPIWLAVYLAKVRPKGATEGWMFPSENGEPHRVGYSRKPIDRGGQKVGLVKLTPHRLRATFATLHVEAKTPLPKIQQMLGHSEITTTMRYVEDSTAGLRDAMAKVARAMGLGVSSKPGGKPTVTRQASGGKKGGKGKMPNPKKRK